MEFVAEKHETAVDGEVFDAVGVVGRLAADLCDLALYHLYKLVKGVERVPAVRQLLLNQVRIESLHVLSGRRASSFILTK